MKLPYLFSFTLTILLYFFEGDEGHVCSVLNFRVSPSASTSEWFSFNSVISNKETVLQIRQNIVEENIHKVETWYTDLHRETQFSSIQSYRHSPKLRCRRFFSSPYCSNNSDLQSQFESAQEQTSRFWPTFHLLLDCHS